MRKIVTQIMKGHLRNELPFVMRSFLLPMHPEMLNATLGEMVWAILLSQPGRALTGEDVHTLLIPFLIVRRCREKIVIERPTRQIVQIQRPGFAAFGIHKRNASGSLIDLTLIHAQGCNFADAQP